MGENEKRRGLKKVWEEKNEKNIQFNSLDPSKTEITFQYIKLTLHRSFHYAINRPCFLGEKLEK
jgi:hypothetical protein